MSHVTNRWMLALIITTAVILMNIGVKADTTLTMSNDKESFVKEKYSTNQPISSIRQSSANIQSVAISSNPVILSNSKLKITIYPGGGFTGQTIEGKLIFFPGDTSMVSLRIGSFDYNLNHNQAYLSKPTYLNPMDSNEVITEWDLPSNIHVEQHMRLDNDQVKFNLIIKNNDVAHQIVSARYLWDTMLANNDGSPLMEEGGTTPRVFEQAFSPVDFNYWSAYDKPELATIVTYGSWDSANKPDRIIFASWPSSINTIYDYAWSSSRRFDSDSAVLMYWEGKTLSPGESKSITVNYGTTKNVGMQLDVATNKCEYGKGEEMKIVAKISDPNGWNIFTNSFSVKIDGVLQNNIKFEQQNNMQGLCNLVTGNYLITGLKAPNSPGYHTVEVKVSTGVGNAVVTKNFMVNNYPTYKVLMILASPYDITSPCCGGIGVGRPSIEWPIISGTDWYNTKDESGTYYGSPEWYKKAANELHDYYLRISYNKVYLETTVSDKWYTLPKKEKDYDPRTTQLWGYTSGLFANGENEYNDAKIIAKDDFDFNNFDVIVVVDPTGYSDNRYGWHLISGLIFSGGSGLLIGTGYDEDKPLEDMVTTLAHEISHWIDIKKNGAPTIKTNHGDNLMYPWSVFSSFTMGAEPPFDPVNAKKLGFSDYSEVSIPTR